MNASTASLWFEIFSVYNHPDFYAPKDYRSKQSHFWNASMGYIYGANLARSKKAILLPKLTEPEIKILHSIMSKFDISNINKMPVSIDFDEKLNARRVDFEGFVFPVNVSFKNIEFEDWVSFDRTIFLEDASFNNCIFSDEADFSFAIFRKGGSFKNTSFMRSGLFDDVNFIQGADFQGASFASHASFIRTKFGKTSYFNQVEFNNVARFTDCHFTALEIAHCKFKDLADFSNSRFLIDLKLHQKLSDNHLDFSGCNFESIFAFEGAEVHSGVSLRNCHFADHAYFQDAQFHSIADFSNSSFENSLILYDTVFKKVPPYFYDAKMPEDLQIQGLSLPDCKLIDHIKPSDFIMAYERLKYIMSKQEREHDKHLFFRKEMQARRISEGRLTPRNFFSFTMSWFYEKSCDYGYGFERALFCWLLNIVVGAILLFPYKKYSINLTFEGLRVLLTELSRSIGLSFGNANSYLGLHKGALDETYSNIRKEDMTIINFDIVWITQSVFGIILLFLLLLTIRNRFKMA